jgi:hypothetical protein
MYNLTISLDHVIVGKARIHAIYEGTSVSAMVREFFRLYAKLESVVLDSAKNEALELGQK